MDAAWQTYHAKACEHLAALEPVEHGDGHTVTPILSNETRAQIATAWAVLALVEVLKPHDDVVMEVKPPDLEARFEHARALVEMQSEYERLVPWVGHEVFFEGASGVLSAVSRADTDNAVCWASFASRTRGVPDQTVDSTFITMSRLRVEGPTHSRCGECNQTTGNYHLSNCSHNTVAS